MREILIKYMLDFKPEMRWEQSITNMSIHKREKYIF